VENDIKLLITEIDGSNKFLTRDVIVYTGLSFRCDVYSSYDDLPGRFNTDLTNVLPGIMYINKWSLLSFTLFAVKC
jgi:hypothetical protein